MKNYSKTLFASVVIIFIFSTNLHPGIFTVTNSNSSGSGSLYQAVLDANNTAGADTILFAAGVRGTINNNGTLELTEGLTILGPGPNLLTITSGGGGRVIEISDAHDAAFNFIGLTISGGECSTGPGAGIFAYTNSVNIINCIIKDNVVTYPNSGGGGIYILSGEAVIENSLIENNTNQLAGAGISINSNGYIKNTSIINNTVTDVNPTWGGGGIYNVGNLTLVNCTIAGNTHPEKAGGIYHNLYGQVKLFNCTVVNNNSDTGGGIGNFSSSPTDTMITLCHTIVANNTATEGNDLYGMFGSLGYNLIEDVNGAIITGDETGNIYGTDPSLGNLTGFSPTVKAFQPVTGSCVIDSGNNLTCQAIDQRGINRPKDGDENGNARADIGAIERIIDNDVDGVSDNEEMGPDGNDQTYDGNLDGTPDCNQSNVSSLWNYNQEFYLTISQPDGYSLIDVKTIDNPSPENAPNVDFPIGFLSFTVDLQGESSCSINILLPEGIVVDNYYKYGQTPDLTMPHWYEFINDSQTGVTIVKPNEIILHLVDGERGDDDITPNNYIVEPGGPSGSITSAEDEKLIPSIFKMEQNYPNPFNPSTKINWQSPVSGWQTLKIYDILGNEVATLVNEYKPAGKYEVEFQSTVDSRQLASGIYFYQLKAGDFIQTRKMILIK